MTISEKDGRKSRRISLRSYTPQGTVEPEISPASYILLYRLYHTNKPYRKYKSDVALILVSTLLFKDFG